MRREGGFEPSGLLWPAHLGLRMSERTERMRCHTTTSDRQPCPHRSGQSQDNVNKKFALK